MNHRSLGFLAVTVAIALPILGGGPSPGSVVHATSAGDGGAAMPTSQLAALRGATARFHRVEAAVAEGYVPFGGCFSDPGGTGAMGFHYVNDALVADPAIDPLRPELLVYAARPSGGLRLVAVEWITFVSAWHGAGQLSPPSLFGREFHINPTLLAEPFYLLHAWIWKHNPSGMFADWNPHVSCE
jgi:hypothetical protein